MSRYSRPFAVASALITTAFTSPALTPLILADAVANPSTARSQVLHDGDKIDFEYFEGLSQSGKGAEIKAFLDTHFPPGSPVTPALNAAKAGGAKCAMRESPTGGVQHACRKYLTPPLKNTFLGSIEWNVIIIENPTGIIESTQVIRSLSGS